MDKALKGDIKCNLVKGLALCEAHDREVTYEEVLEMCSEVNDWEVDHVQICLDDLINEDYVGFCDCGEEHLGLTGKGKGILIQIIATQALGALVCLVSEDEEEEEQKVKEEKKPSPRFVFPNDPSLN